MRRDRGWETERRGGGCAGDGEPGGPDDGERQPRPGAAPTKPRRKPVFTLTPEQVLQRCREGGREIICAGQVLVVMELMRLAGWTIAELAERSQVSESHLSEFLRVKKFFTLHCSRRVARAFHLPLSCLMTLAEHWVAAEDSP